jgi:hypothetical protein
MLSGNREPKWGSWFTCISGSSGEFVGESVGVNPPAPSCHVCAAIPNFLVLERHWIQNLALWEDFVKEGDIFEKGWIPVTDRPGIG